MEIERAIVKGTLFDVVQVRNMFTAQVTEVGGDTSEVMWDTYLEMLYADVLSLMVDSLVFYAYEIQRLNGEEWETVDEVTFSHAGENTAAALPNAVALVLLGKASGIRHIGRKFFSGLTEDATTDNTMGTGTLATCASALLNYISPVTGLGGGYLLPGVVDSVNGFHPFVGGTVSSLLGSMRRRKPGVGI